MAWVRLDDSYPEHPKVDRAGPLAAWLNVCAWAYCARNLTDGFVPEERVARLAEVANAKKLAAVLVDCELWEKVEGGYRVHDYLVYNPSRETVLKERAATARRVADYRATHGVSNGVTPPITERVTNGVSTPRSNGVSTAAPLTSRIRPEGTVSVIPEATGPGARAPDVAPPRRASGDESNETNEPDRLPNGAKQCPTCPQVFVGSYSDHLETASTHKIHETPEDFRPKPRRRHGEPRDPVPPEIHAELDAMARAKAERGPVALPPDLAAEHARLLTRQRERHPQGDVS